MEEALNDAVNLLGVVPKDASKAEVFRAMTKAAQEGSYTVGPEYNAVRQKIKEFESFRSHVYLDGKGHPTQGYGHKLSNETYESEKSSAFKRDWGNTPTWSKERANIAFEIDLQREYSRLRETYAASGDGVEGFELTFDQLPLEAREVLLDVSFNAGGYFGKKFPGMFRGLQDGDFHRSGLELMYRNGSNLLSHDGDDSSQFSDYYIGNNGPDRHPETGRKIFQDRTGQRYTERSQTVALDRQGRQVNPKTTTSDFSWYNLPTVNPSTGYYYGKRTKEIKRRVHPMDSSVVEVDMGVALAQAHERKELIGPFETTREAVAAAQERSAQIGAGAGEDKANAKPNSRANYNIARLMHAKLPENLQQGNYANPEYQAKYAADLQQSLLEETK